MTDFWPGSIFHLSKSYDSGIVFHQQLILDSDENSCADRVEFCAGTIQGGRVGVAEILTQIDREIAQLQRARALLNGNGKVSLKASGNGTRKRNLTPEGRQRISEAVRRRWARQRKAAAGK